MLSRGNLLLLAVLVLQIVLLVVSVVTTSGTETRAVEPIVAGMSAADIDRLSFSDDLGNEVTVARTDDGWALPDADDFPVDGDKVEAILDKIARLDTRRLVATKTENFARLEVQEGDFRRKVALESADASALLYLGGSGGADTVYVRRADDDNVYLGVGLNAWELSTQVSTWLDSSYVNVAQDDILEVRVENAAGSFTFVREGDSLTYAGLAEGEEFEDTKLPIILRNAATVRLHEPLGLAALDEYELAEPRVTVAVRYRELVGSDEPPLADSADAVDSEDESSTEETESAEPENANEPLAEEAESAEPEYAESTYTLSFGAELEDGVALKSSAAEYYVLVRDTVFNAFNDIKREDLIRLPDADPTSDS